MTVEEAERAGEVDLAERSDEEATGWAGLEPDVGPRRRLPRLLLDSTVLVARAGPVGFTVSAVLAVVGAVAAAGVVFASKVLISALVGVSLGTRTVRETLPAVMLIGIATGVASASAAVQGQQQRLLGEQVVSAVWRRLTRATGRVPLDHYEDPKFHDRLQRVVVNSLNRPAAISTALIGLLGGVAGTVAIGSALLMVQPILIPVLVAAGIPALVMARFSSRSEFAFATATNQLTHRRTYLRALLVSRDAAKEVRAFGAAGALRDSHEEVDRTFLRSLRRQVTRRHVYTTVVVTFSSAVLCLTIALITQLIADQTLDFGEAGAAIIGARLLAIRLSQAFNSIGAMVEARPFLVDLETFLDLATRSGREPVVGATPAPHRDCLRLDEVSYSYPGATRPALSSVSLQIRPGEVIALVGENGSGKTTLAKLVAGLYAAQAGQITWDGVDTAELDEGAVSRAVAVIFQDFMHYHLSVTENIGIGEPAGIRDESAARAAAQAAGADEFLSRLPRGYDTLLTNEFMGGTELSLGQWQRVALARAMRRDASLVVLDEPSSALDPRSEAALFSDVRRLVGTRSVLFISHRFASVRHADRIYVLHEGSIIESGNHEALMARGGAYAEMFSLQAHAYR